MQGWIKLMETIRNSDPPSNESATFLPNSNFHNYRNSMQHQNLFNQSLPLTTNTNDYLLKSSERINTIITLDSPPNIFDSSSIISLDTTPRQIIDDILSVENELISRSRLRRESIISLEIESPTTTASSIISSTDSKQSPVHSKRNSMQISNTFREPISTMKSNHISTPITEDISDDDDVPLVDIRKQKIISIDTLSIPSANDSIIPLATDLQSLPGHIQNDIRDIRFLIYSDIDTLSMHLHTCLYLDKQSSSSPITPNNLKTCNVLKKIFKIYYIKTFRKHLYLEKKISFIKNDKHKQQPLSMISSPTSTSFTTDWTVNRRNPSSTQRQIPKNPFHILQLEPAKQFLTTDNSSSSNIISKSPIEKFETVKDILARTYYPHLYTAIECGYHFGEKSKFPNTQQLITTHGDITFIKEMPQSPPPPDVFNDPIAITLKTPPPTTRRDSIISQPSPIIMKNRNRQSNNSKNDDSRSLSSIHVEPCMDNEIDELSPWAIKKSVVILTPTKIPLPSRIINEKDKPLTNNNRKRKFSNTNIKENKKNRIESTSSLETINHIEDITEPESDDDDDDGDEDYNVLPSELPKQCLIKNGLRSNYYKTRANDKSKPISNKSFPERRRLRRQSSGSLPSFYTGIFESDDAKSSYIDYRLPYDIYWQEQQKTKQPTMNNHFPHMITSTISILRHNKKKSSKPKQKQLSPYKKIFRNVYSDQLRQHALSLNTTEHTPTCECKPPQTCEDGVCLNRVMFTECTIHCACGVKCTNQRVRKNLWYKHLEVFDTGKYGQGLRTTNSISKGTFLCEYVGEVITEEQFYDRMINLYSKDEHHYTMKLTQNLVIDAYRMGSIARFANHSCSPNCGFEKWSVDGLQRMCMFPLRTIKAGEELTYDYNFQCFNVQTQQACYCESPKCRGKIGTKQKSTTSSIITNNDTNSSITIQRLTQREKRRVLQSSIFLLRNLKRIKTKQELKNKNSNTLQQQQQTTDNQSATSLFFTQNYYHSNGSNNRTILPNLRKNPTMIHKEMFYLFYNHIRRSHFVKTGRHNSELIDDTCYYAQLAQLNLILNEIFDLILYHRGRTRDIIPANALKKCPSKRLYPAYYQIITKPIDLKRIRNKLDNGEYLSFELFELDLLLLFNNAITYCGADSHEGQAVLELQNYFLNTIKLQYKTMLNLFTNMQEEQTDLNTLENFIERLHKKETIDGQIRQILYDIIYNISDKIIDDDDDDDDETIDNSPIVYKIVLDNKPSSHRASRSRTGSDCIVHCRCGSVYDEISLVQCYACQLWQHVTCVSIDDSSRPYYCFECVAPCEQNPSACLKTNVLLAATLSPLQTYDDNHESYSTLTRSDGFVIRINECYFVVKQDEKNIDRSLVSPEYDILFVERLWYDDYGVGQASGFFYIRPNETFHEPTRKFYLNEVFRFPSSNDPLPISLIVRPCFVFDIGTYRKGKPISDNSNRVLSSDLFICDYRVDKTARTFTRWVKTKQYPTNTKPYCFDTYVERLSPKRDYQPYQKELQQQKQDHHHHHHDNRRRAINHSNKLTHKQLQERHTRINGIIEKIYCRHYGQNSVPDEINYSIEQFLQQSFIPPSLIDINHHNNNNSPLIENDTLILPLQSPAEIISKKRRTISLSSDDDIVELIPENDCPPSKKRGSTGQSTISPR
ncbi:unnamed protein product [Adineta steineri]|uniref:Histone-lysine N-methyltransferase n=1 Tax=Adineta steineri TaxID=433720 RepID=A0A814EGY1_9BILA|nr:unnamed protein product [Adineta steineri]CAF1038235.1 unnamed protein product [Adineta steineri]